MFNLNFGTLTQKIDNNDSSVIYYNLTGQIKTKFKISYYNGAYKVRQVIFDFKENEMLALYYNIENNIVNLYVKDYNN